MQEFQTKPIDKTILSMMKKVYQNFKINRDPHSYQFLLLQEKVIYTSLLCYSNPTLEIEKSQISHLGSLIVDFAQKINEISMKNFEVANSKNKNGQKLINKSISILMMPQVGKYMQESQLTKLKILNFNNITCIYKKLKKFGIALRSINYAIELQQKLLLTNNNEQKYDIIPTYLNKAAIYSEMKKHRQAIDIILKAKTHIYNIQNQLIKQIQTTTDAKIKQRLIQKRYYGLYMKMIILYNMGAQKQHIHIKTQALDYYKQSKQVASIIGNQLMINKLANVIDSLMAE